MRCINSSWKWNPVKNKIIDACCDIVCLQETKKETVDALRKICSLAIDSFDSCPLLGPQVEFWLLGGASFFMVKKSIPISLLLLFSSAPNMIIQVGSSFVSMGLVHLREKIPILIG